MKLALNIDTMDEQEQPNDALEPNTCESVESWSKASTARLGTDEDVPWYEEQKEGVAESRWAEPSW